MSDHVLLATSSKIRQAILKDRGVPYRVIEPECSEDEVKQKLSSDLGPDELAVALSKAKALSVSNKHTQAVVIGADQIAYCEGKILEKTKSVADCLSQLKFLSGRTHRLFSAVCLYLNSQCIWSDCQIATMSMRKLTDEEIQQYILIDSPINSCGAYYYECMGYTLFESVNGDKETILGMPCEKLLPIVQSYIANK